MKNIIEKLAKCILFKNLNEEILQHILSTGMILNYDPNKIIFKENENSDAMYIVLNGSIEIFSLIESKKIVFTKVKEYEFFGEMAMISKSSRSASAMTLEKTQLFLLTDKSFNELKEKFPGVLCLILKDMLKITFKRLKTLDKRFLLKNIYS